MVKRQRTEGGHRPNLFHAASDIISGSEQAHIFHFPTVHRPQLANSIFVHSLNCGSISMTSSERIPPTNCGERTLPGTIDRIAFCDPERVWARYPRSSEDLEAGQLHSVTFGDLANAIDTLAWRLHENLADRQPLSTIAYIGPSDIRCFILACAACKLGLKVCGPATFVVITNL